MEHRNIPAGEIHAIANWSVATTAERDLLVVTAADVGKVCQVRGDKHYVLVVHSPMQWESLGGNDVVTTFADYVALTAYAPTETQLLMFAVTLDTGHLYILTEIGPPVWVDISAAAVPAPLLRLYTSGSITVNAGDIVSRPLANGTDVLQVGVGGTYANWTDLRAMSTLWSTNGICVSTTCTYDNAVMAVSGVGTIVSVDNMRSVSGGRYGSYNINIGGYDNNLIGIATAQDYNVSIGGRSGIIGDFAGLYSGAVQYAVRIGGYGNFAARTGAVVVGGLNTAAYGVYSAVVAGDGTQANGSRSVALGGKTAIAIGDESVVLGGDTLSANGTQSVAIAGNNTTVGAHGSAVACVQSTVNNKTHHIGTNYCTSVETYGSIVTSATKFAGSRTRKAVSTQATLHCETTAAATARCTADGTQAGSTSTLNVPAHLAKPTGTWAIGTHRITLQAVSESGRAYFKEVVATYKWDGTTCTKINETTVYEHKNNCTTELSITLGLRGSSSDLIDLAVTSTVAETVHWMCNVQSLYNEA